MKKFFALLVVLSTLLTFTLLPFVVKAEEDNFVTVYRKFTISSENIKEGDSVLMNPRLWWQFAANTEVPFAIEIDNVTIKSVDGNVIDKFIASAPNSLELGSSVPPQEKYNVGDTIKIEGGWILGNDYQMQVWSNGTQSAPAGDYIMSVDIRISDVNEEALAKVDQYNLVRFNVWGDNIASEIFMTDGDPISLEELQMGTDAYKAEPEGPIEEPGDEDTPPTNDVALSIQLMLVAASVLGGYKLRRE